MWILLKTCLYAFFIGNFLRVLFGKALVRPSSEKKIFSILFCSEKICHVVKYGVIFRLLQRISLFLLHHRVAISCKWNGRLRIFFCVFP